MRNNYIFLLFIHFFILFQSCGLKNGENPTLRRITQSLKIHDDNVNGIDLRTLNSTLKENARFYYNSNDLLDSLDVFSDTTTSGVFVKSVKLKYMTDRIRAFTYDSSGYVALDLFFNSSRQIIKLIDTLGLGYGLHFTYVNNKISAIKIVLDSTYYLNNFVYDGDDNLIQYVITDNLNQPLTRVKFEYDLSKKIPKNLDIRFASGGIRFLYAGGVNVFSLMNINYGVGNTNRIISRKEYNLQTNQNSAVYLFDYTLNNNQEITSRKIILNDTIHVFYEYRY